MPKVKLTKTEFNKIMADAGKEPLDTKSNGSDTNIKELRIWMNVENVKMRHESEERGTTVKDFVEMKKRNEQKKEDGPLFSKILGVVFGVTR